MSPPEPAGLSSPDEFYAALLRHLEGETTAQSLKRCARFILLLANEVGDETRLMELLLAATRDSPP